MYVLSFKIYFILDKKNCFAILASDVRNLPLIEVFEFLYV